MAAEDTRHGFTPTLVVLLTLLGNSLQYTNNANGYNYSSSIPIT